MKKIVFLTYFVTTLLLIAGAVQAQNRHSKGQFERIETEKIAFITKELQLTPKEAQTFFPFYNEYRNEINGVLRSEHASRDRQSKSRMDELAMESALLNIKKKYRSKFSEIIGSSRASRFFEVEREFREKLLNELKRRGDRGPDQDQETPYHNFLD